VVSKICLCDNESYQVSIQRKNVFVLLFYRFVSPVTANANFVSEPPLLLSESPFRKVILFPYCLQFNVGVKHSKYVMYVTFWYHGDFHNEYCSPHVSKVNGSPWKVYTRYWQLLWYSFLFKFFFLDKGNWIY